MDNDLLSTHLHDICHQKLTLVKGIPFISSDASTIRPEALDPKSGFESTMMAQKMTYRHSCMHACI